MTKLQTMKIGGADYAKVRDRVAAVHEDHNDVTIETSYEFSDGWAIFSAIVSFNGNRYYGHAMDKVAGQQKRFEKLESIAVGRALAFAGYLANGEIASYEEIADTVSTVQLNALKLKWASENREELSGLDQKQQRERFNSWCKSLIGEDVDYGESESWRSEWYRSAMDQLTSGQVPFE